MKNLMILLGSFLVLGCSNEHSGYVIEGEFFVPNRTIYLCNSNKDTLAAGQMTDGKFKLEGATDSIQVAFLDYGERDKISIILENETINLKINSLNIHDIELTSNGYEQLIFRDYLKLNKENEDLDKISTLRYKKMSNDNDTTAYDTYLETVAKRRRSEDAILEKYPDSYTSLFIANRWKSDTDEADLITRFENLGKKYSNTSLYKDLESKYNSLKNITVGKTVPDFTMPNEKGEEISLYSIKGKVKIIDFWASWCGPCRGLNPEMLKLYNQYKSSGLEIVSVSMDENKKSWLKAVEEDKLPWTQISDLKAWSSPVAKVYNFEAIPYLVILNEKNEIIALNLHAQELREFLKERLSK